MARTKTTLIMLVARFNNQSMPSLQHPRVRFLRKLRCDPSIIGTHSLVPFLKNWEHQRILPLQLCFPGSPCVIEEDNVLSPGPQFHSQSIHSLGWFLFPLFE
ncbi:hypothetical protein CHARACLAT_030621 [Characodon lateralis]|uniref:Uncharacterized protein n=1 Tax=Characodon lateralis TaxID=208331 RepID=A0ABU7EY66_9TELE|nr:hypothetical protein [Characodon lateralis]